MEEITTLQISQHSLESGNEYKTSSDFSIISRNFYGNKWKRKIVESLFINQLLGTLNIHDKSVLLILFN